MRTPGRQHPQRLVWLAVLLTLTSLWTTPAMALLVNVEALEDYMNERESVAEFTAALESSEDGDTVTFGVTAAADNQYYETTPTDVVVQRGVTFIDIAEALQIVHELELEGVSAEDFAQFLWTRRDQEQDIGDLAAINDNQTDVYDLMFDALDDFEGDANEEGVVEDNPDAEEEGP